MIKEPFWLGLITVGTVLLIILMVYCVKRKFADKIEKFLADEIERSKNSKLPCPLDPRPLLRYQLSCIKWRSRQIDFQLIYSAKRQSFRSSFAFADILINQPYLEAVPTRPLFNHLAY